MSRRRSHRRIAFSLALVGQLAATIGLPLPVFSSPDQSSAAAIDSDCGCCPADRAAKRCCCNLLKSPPAPAEEAPPGGPACCAKRHANAQHDGNEQVAKKPNAEESAPTTMPLKFRWLGGIMRQRCLGQFEHALSAVYVLAYPAEAPTTWSIDRGIADRLRTTSSSPISLPSLPDTPPPR